MLFRSDVLKHRNVVISILITICLMSWSMVINTYGIIYLSDGKGFDLIMAGSIFSAYGVGNFAGAISMAAISDYIGRRLTIILGTLMGGIAFGVLVTVQGLPLYAVMALMFLTAFLGVGVTTLSASIIPSESVPIPQIATATALTPAISEMFGGVLAPALCGAIIAAVGVGTTFMSLAVFPVIALILAILDRKSVV